MAKHNIWTSQEIDLLKSWVGKKPLQQIIIEWNDQAKKRGWRERSPNGIEVKAKRLFKGRGIVACRDSWTIRTLSKLLDITHTRIIKWQRKGLKINGYSYDASGRPHISAITRANLKVFALAHPEYFNDIDPVRLSRIFKDKNYVKLISAAEQVYHGRAVAVLRLDSGDAYWCAAAAGKELNIANTAILDCCDRDTPMKNGMDWARLDYPIYLVPRSVRDEFNSFALKVLYEFYLQLRSLDGYSKTNCLIVAGRNAVEITLIAFRKNFKQLAKGEELSPKQLIIEHWQTRFMESLQTFLPLNSQQGYRRIINTVKHRAYSVFAKFFSRDRSLLDLHLEEYALWWIAEQSRRYFNKSFLPKNYQPSNQIETADLFSFIYSSIITRVELKENVFIPLVILQSWKYIERKQLIEEELIIDLSETVSDEEQTSLQNYASSQLAVVQNNDDLLTEFIEHVKQSVNPSEYEILKLYLDLKLEECSDKEIASAINIVVEDVLKIEQKIKYLAREYN